MLKLVATLVLVVASSRPAPAAPPAASDPLEFYRGYLGVLATATSLEALLPYYTKELADGLRGMPQEMQANYLKMNARKLTALEVTKQTVEDGKAILEMTAKTEDGRPTSGSATLVKEGGAWKVENEAGAAPLP